MEEVTDEPLYRDRVCGIDIGKAGLYATIRVPSDTSPQRRMSETRSFATTRRGVLALADWLRSWQVPAVVMEATSTYWMGPFFRLEAEGFECVLADARQVKNLPGRPKRDPSDSSWLAQCFERGAVRPCFVATAEFRVIRLHTRYRRDLINERTREKNRAEKLLETAAIKLSSTSSPGSVTRRSSRSWPAPGPGPRSPSCSTPWRARSSSPVTTRACSRPCCSASTRSTTRSTASPP